MDGTKRAFVFVDQWDSVTLNNFELIGQISSSAAAMAWSDPSLKELYLSGKLKYTLGSEDDPTWLRTLSTFAIDHAYDAMELELEEVRFEEFALLPSRMSAVYLFPDRTTCDRVADMHGWSLDEVREVLVEEDPLLRVHTANMNLVSQMRGMFDAGDIPADAERRDIWRRYWRGDPDLPFAVDDERARQPLWELLVEGFVRRTDDPRNLDRLGRP